MNSSQSVTNKRLAFVLRYVKQNIRVLTSSVFGHASSFYLLAYDLGSSIAGVAGGYFWIADGWSAVAEITFVMLALAFAAALDATRLS